MREIECDFCGRVSKRSSVNRRHQSNQYAFEFCDQACLEKYKEAKVVKARISNHERIMRRAQRSKQIIGLV